jgi:hypothetical protein
MIVEAHGRSVGDFPSRPFQDGHDPRGRADADSASGRQGRETGAAKQCLQWEADRFAARPRLAGRKAAIALPDARALSVLIASERGSTLLFEHDLFRKTRVRPSLRGGYALCGSCSSLQSPCCSAAADASASGSSVSAMPQAAPTAAAICGAVTRHKFSSVSAWPTGMRGEATRLTPARSRW